MKLKLVSAIWLLAALNLQAQAPAAAKEPVAPAAPSAPVLTLKAVTDRADALYKTGEAATLTIEAQQDGKPISGKVTCVFSKDGLQPQPAQTLELKEGKATITGKLDEPGFLQLRVTSGKTTALAAAGYDPLLLKPSMPVPDDFDAFWQAQKAALAQVPLKPVLTPVEKAPKGVEAFDVQIECLGKPVSGYFGRPQGAKPKSLPAILHVHGAGVRSANLGAVSWALNEGGMLSMDINAHGLPNGKPKEYYDALAAGELKDYRIEGAKDREKIYFKGMFLRLIRAIDFLTAQPEWDGKTLIVYGASQGGFQAFAAAGLDARVSFICAGVPAGCDHTGSQANRISGWPKIVPNDASGKPDPEALQASRYFDNMNFATRAKCKGAVVTVGFIDTTCPPTSVYAAYNALTIPKEMHTDVLTGHASTPAASKFMQAAALKHVRENKGK
ncbi:acetylxylan esterase [Prosthecobacter vanneervenii]|uniref:Cephalosporin-C deacetylase-like acetyl esterase n=1 Tax=Prosthecobacter vanneervenii TaxID=48466 RepID=A0A7W8DJE4_9BACT|nr:acetylxylan esterase [Prosthecobacter vanneervenii]MBB5032044.1 cephalosporin-C deacetylase-like acetyl esterase [Prosthecobacter vanneervenii]